jgi:hypothetical protein
MGLDWGQIVTNGSMLDASRPDYHSLKLHMATAGTRYKRSNRNTLCSKTRAVTGCDD